MPTSTRVKATRSKCVPSSPCTRRVATTQLNVEAIRRAGVGNLYEAFLRVKEKLNAQGLFDPARKRALPLFARAIGIVTSPQAACLGDILSRLKGAPPCAGGVYPRRAGQFPRKIAGHQGAWPANYFCGCREGHQTWFT